MRELSRFLTILAVTMSISCVVTFTGSVFAQTSGGGSETAPVTAPVIDHDVAPVVIDGEQIFSVPGISALPAKKRANQISQRIIEIAEGSSQPPVIDVRASEFGRAVIVDGVEVMVVTTLDAEVAALDMPTLAEAISDAIGEAVHGYRDRRSSQGLIRSATSAALWTVAIIVFLSTIYFGNRFLRERVQHRVRARFRDIEASTSQIVRADAIVSAITAVLWIVLLFLTFIALYYYLTQVLMAFPATRGLAQVLLNYFLGPIGEVFRAILAEIPDLITIVVIAVATAYLIRFVRLVFVNVERGRLEVEGFEHHWIWPTYRIVKFGIILFAVVVAYPYIPGSGTAAFQGVTIFLGVLLSFGSSSVISNLLAGLFVIYRRSVNLGDLIGIGDVIGRIEAVNLLETDLRTPKNELVSVPNSQLLGSQLTNYTRYGNGGGLIVHSTVGIGYEEPQRKIEAMLIEAAQRTRGIESDPLPFVLRTALADFAVNYEINAYARHVDALPKLQSDLNANILDVFNERKVQIMTPAYERDPEEPKIAPMDESDADGVPRNR